MKKYHFLIILIALSYFLANSLKAQSTPSDSLPSLQFIPKLEIGLVQGIGLTAEIPINQMSIFELGTGLGSGYTIFENEFANTWALDNPAFYLQAKYKLYYNRQKRLDKGKSILNNSGNYVGFRFKYASRELNPANISGINFYEFHQVTLWDIHWGIQRTMGKRFLFNLNLGLGYGYDWDFENGMVYPAGDVRFSYKLWK